MLNFTFLFVLQYGRLLVKAKFGSIRRCLYELVLSSVTYGFGAPRPNTNRCSRMSANNVQALFACSRCFSRHPFEELSPGQQLCKVLLWILIFFLEKFSLFLILLKRHFSYLQDTMLIIEFLIQIHVSYTINTIL